MKYIAYVRKSTEQEERQSLSIPAQKRKIKESFPNLSIVKWIEESKSAFKPGRAGFDEMMAMLDKQQAHGIVGWHPDRLSRNEVDAAKITYGIRTGLIQDLKFGSYFFDNSPEGIMMLQNVMSHSQYFSSKLSKDIKRGNEEQRKRGWLTGNAMEGYLNNRNSKEVSYGTIIKDPERFPLRRKMWDLMLTGNYSVPQIIEIANSKWGYRTRGNRKYPSGPLTRASAYHMFNNPRYAGLIPIPDTLSYENAAYDPMVTIEEFDRVQELLGGKGTRKLAAKKEFNFRGVLFCKECNCAITAEEKIKHFKNGIVKRYIYYHCTHKRRCNQRKNVREEDLEQQFTELLGRYTILPQFKDWALEVLEQQNDIETTDINTIIESQNKTIESAHAQMKRLIKMATQELISEAQFLQEKLELEQQISSLEEEQEDTKKRAKNWYAIAEKIFDLAVHGRERFLTGNVDVKKEMLADFGYNPSILNGKLEITPNPWLVPIEKGYKELEAEFIKVRNQSQQRQKTSLESIRSSWCSIVNEVRTCIILQTAT